MGEITNKSLQGKQGPGLTAKKCQISRGQTGRESQQNRLRQPPAEGENSGECAITAVK